MCTKQYDNLFHIVAICLLYYLVFTLVKFETYTVLVCFLNSCKDVNNRPTIDEKCAFTIFVLKFLFVKILVSLKQLVKYLSTKIYRKEKDFESSLQFFKLLNQFTQ